MTIDSVSVSVVAQPAVVAVVEGAGPSITIERAVTHVTVEGDPAAAVTLEHADIALVLEAQTQAVVVTQDETIAVVIPADQGPAGPPGSGAGEHAQRTDFADPRYWFVEYASRIKRLDQSVSPATVGFATGAWADRLTLSYT